MATNKTKARAGEDCPTAWFCVLERARLDGDREREQQALRELKRLGVKVDWPREPEGVARD